MKSPIAYYYFFLHQVCEVIYQKVAVPKTFQIVLLRFRFLFGGALKILKTCREGIENLPITSTGDL
jgi:hypothetical protein